MDELIDITDYITQDNLPSYLNDIEYMELFDTCLCLMEELIKENPTIITEIDFDEIFNDNINELIHAHFDDDMFYTEEAEDEISDVIMYAKEHFFKEFIPPRSYPNTFIILQPDMDSIQNKICILNNKPQPIQRTKEWYHFRHNLITASNAYKAFESQATKNQLIYEKCQPLNSDNFENNIVECEESKINHCDNNDNIKKLTISVIADNPYPKMVNVNTPLHWGQKYEPLSVLIYEYIYNTKIGDFGCIEHKEYSFIGASPDGINIDQKSSRYGRMLEIKNVVSREITGIPKKEYWIQMQLQMEVCDLDECDFLETKFIEYDDYNSYLDDSYKDEYSVVDINLSKDEKIKGVIIYFHTKEGNPIYIYKPLNITDPIKITEWEETNITLYQSSKYNHTFIKFLYWKQECNSCVLVCRNRQWFEDNVSGLSEIWTIIEKERVTGYEHRAPNQKIKKDNIDMTFNNNNNGSGCLLQFNKNTAKILVNKS